MTTILGTNGIIINFINSDNKENVRDELFKIQTMMICEDIILNNGL